MNKKDLKWYEAPACEVVELKVASILCASAGTTGGSDDIPADDVDPGFFN